MIDKVNGGWMVDGYSGIFPDRCLLPQYAIAKYRNWSKPCAYKLFYSKRYCSLIADYLLAN